MALVTIAVASIPLTATIDEAVPAATAAIDEAGRLGASIVCLPESAIPGHRVQRRSVPDLAQDALDDAMRVLSDAARQAGIAAIVGTERRTGAGREIVSIVVGADGTMLGEQPKTQIDPSEEADYVPGSGRRVFTAAGVTFGIAICHEAFRYPEIVRSLALGGAQVVFVPHFVTTDDGTLPVRWCDASNPYNEKALLCRALENSVYVGASNVAAPDQGSVTGIIAPDGTLVASLGYGRIGVVAAEVELDRADRRIARRWDPHRSVVGGIAAGSAGRSRRRAAARAAKGAS
jgi:predicted amidohydrolase